MIFTGILITVATANLLFTLWRIGNTPKVFFEAGLIDLTPIRNSFLVTGGLLLWAAYRIWG